MNEFFYNFLAWINSWAGSWGIAMIIFTILIRLLMTPLDFKSRASMRKTTKLQPKVQALQKKYANDKDKLNAKMAELYKKEHVNPMSSCLPMLLTWPILIIVFGAMRMAANKELLGQLTQLLNGQEPVLEQFLWIKNLWMPDNLFSSAYPDLNTLRVIPGDQWLTWFKGLEQSGMPALLQTLNLTEESFSNANLGATIQSILDVLATVKNADGVAFYAEAISSTGYAIPLVNWFVPKLFNGFLLLPILSAVSQIVMTKITTAGQPQQQPDAPGAGTGKFMQWFFPIFSLWICLGYSAAFALYWVAGNLVSMAQTVILNRILDKREEAAAAVAGEGSVR